MADYWIPRSVDELEAVVQTHALSESLFLEVKQFTERTAAFRKTVAKEFAALSIHGGVVIFGITESSNNKNGVEFGLGPTDTTGWREWAETIATQGIQPPLKVSTKTLDRTDGTGYLVVVVPPSVRAPHMVDDKYHGRIDCVNSPLQDHEIREIWLRNLERRRDGETALDIELARNPIPFLSRGPRLFVTAQPVSADPRLLLDAVDEQNLPGWVLDLRDQVRPIVFYEPRFLDASTVHRRAQGAARSLGITPYRKPEKIDFDQQRSLFDFEVREDGGVRLFRWSVQDGNPAAAVVGEVAAVIAVCRQISEVASFRGAWTFGVAMTKIKTLQWGKPYSITHVMTSLNNTQHKTAAAFTDAEYRQTFEASGTELFETGSPILQELLGRFLRAIEAPSAQELDTYPIPRS